MCSDILLFVRSAPHIITGVDHVTVYLSNLTVPKSIISIGKILSNEGLAKVRE